MRIRSIALVAAATVGALASFASAGTLGSVTLTDNAHWGYFASSEGFKNTTGTIEGLSGTAKMIRVTGTLTKVQSAAWAQDLRTNFSSAGLAPTQPWFQYSNRWGFPTPTVAVDQRIYIPNGGFDISKPISYNMFSIADPEFTPGLDGTSTLTFEFQDAYNPGTVEFNGELSNSDPTFNRPMMAYSDNASGYGGRYFSGRRPHYDIQPFRVTANGTYAMVSANEFESALVIYRNEFNPTIDTLPGNEKYTKLDSIVLAAREQTPNVLRNTSFDALPYNDDAVGGSMLEANLIAGVQYYMVTTAQNDSVASEGDGGPFIGSYSNLIMPLTGGGVPILGLIPEPTTLMSLGAGISLLGRRRR